MLALTSVENKESKHLSRDQLRAQQMIIREIWTRCDGAPCFSDLCTLRKEASWKDWYFDGAHTPMIFVHCLKIYGLVYQVAAGDGLCYSAQDELFSRLVFGIQWPKYLFFSVGSRRGAIINFYR
jgi:hypothetical protein